MTLHDRWFVMAVLIVLGLSLSANALESPAQLPSRVVTFDFKDTEIQDVLRTLSSQSGTSIVPEPGISGKITIHVEGLEFEEGLRVLLTTYGLSFSREGNAYRVFRPKPQPFQISFDKPTKLVSIHATAADVSEVIKEMSMQTGQSIVVDRSIKQSVTLNVTALEPDTALKALADACGLALTRKAGYALLGPPEAPPGPGIEVLTVEDGFITARIKDTDLLVFIRELSNRAKLNIIADRDARGTVTGTLTRAPLMSGLATFFDANGLTMVNRSDAFIVRKTTPTTFSVIQRDDGNFDLAVNSADLVQVLRELAEQAKVNLVVYNYVRSQANSVNVADVTLDEAFEFLLRGTNFTIRKDGNTYIVGDGTTPRPDALEFTETRIVRLQYVAAETIPTALPSSIPASVLRVLKEQNAIAITATPEIADRVEGYLKVLDVPGREVVAEVIRPKYVRTEEILPLLTKFFAPQGFQQLKDMSGVIVTGTPETVNQVKEFIAKLDLPSPVRNELIHMKHLKAEDVPKLLPPNFDKASLLILADQNAVVVTGTDATVAQFRQYLESVDVPNPQILFDVVIVEYTRDNSLTAGVSFSGANKTTSLDLNKPDSNGNPSGITVSVDQSKNLSASFSATLNALVQQGKAKILANPKLAALNGESATFNVVSKSYYWDPLYDDSAHSSSGPTTTTTDTSSSLRGGSPRSIEAGIKLKLKPWVSGSGDITIDIEPSISDSSDSGTDLPKTNERSAQTTVRVRDGQTVIIGGLIQSERHEGSFRVPVLSSIPVLGSLFKSRNDLDKQTEFVIYITPYLVSDASDMASHFTQLWTPEDVQGDGAALTQPGAPR